MNESDMIDKVIDMLTQLDEQFEKFKKFKNNNAEKLCVYIKIKELIFWLTYYKELLEEEEE